ncbi:MAG: hypothetical protein ACT4OY_03255 [Alphaproteobacteria bacterium]
MNRELKNQPHSPYSKIIKSAAIKDPERIYEKPQDVQQDNRLDRDDKIRILESWAVDMESLMRAEEENMTSDRTVPRAPEKLREIQDALRCLRDEVY